MPTKLHELLAVESALETQAAKTRSDLAKTFESKRHLFESKKVLFTPNTEGAPAQVENQSDIQSSVLKELDWVQPFFTKSLDASFQVSEANTHARADIILEDDAGTILARNVPATALLELEKRVSEIGTLVHAIPTLDPAKGFSPDAAAGVGIFQARPITKIRTKKDKRVIIKYAATVEHPAQVDLIDEDKPVGTIQEQEWSGLITPAHKAELINRVEMLGRAVRRARSRANEAEVDQTKKIGASLVSFIFQAIAKAP